MKILKNSFFGGWGEALLTGNGQKEKIVKVSSYIKTLFA
jgi:hypothetical protein